MAKAKILVVDDSLFVCKLLNTRLTGSDYEVVTVNSGQEGVDKALEFMPDVILMDINMPGISGIEAGKMLKDNVATRDIPIIMVTARDERSIVLETMGSFHPAAYIVKPFDADKLLIEIDRVLQKKQGLSDE